MAQYTGILPFTLQLANVATILCIICNNKTVYACPTCENMICKECDDEGCFNCNIETILSSKDDMSIEVPAHPSMRLHFDYLYPASSDHHLGYEYIEQGLAYYSFPTIRPTIDQWHHAEHVLQDFITFSLSSESQKPEIGKSYLVGRHSTNYHYDGANSVVTDYMLTYEEVSDGVYGWARYISVYYNKSSYPADINIFYPAPLPIQI
jgi:hypothetical protein